MKGRNIFQCRWNHKYRVTILVFSKIACVAIYRKDHKLGTLGLAIVQSIKYLFVIH